MCFFCNYFCGTSSLAFYFFLECFSSVRAELSFYGSNIYPGTFFFLQPSRQISMSSDLGVALVWLALVDLKCELSVIAWAFISPYVLSIIENKRSTILGLARVELLHFCSFGATDLS